jgi:hypothetical protein
MKRGYMSSIEAGTTRAETGATGSDFKGSIKIAATDAIKTRIIMNPILTIFLFNERL